MEAGHELDAKIAEALGWRECGEYGAMWATADGGHTGWYVREDPDYYACGNRCNVWGPSSDVGQAITAAEELRKAGKVLCWSLFSGTEDDPVPEASASRLEDERESTYATGATPALALSLAIVAAVGEPVTK